MNIIRSMKVHWLSNHFLNIRNAELLLNIISKEACSNYFFQVCSVTADTTSFNTGEKAEVEKRLVDHH